jgi:hypothetical protein
MQTDGEEYAVEHLSGGAHEGFARINVGRTRRLADDRDARAPAPLAEDEDAILVLRESLRAREQLGVDLFDRLICVGRRVVEE